MAFYGHLDMMCSTKVEIEMYYVLFTLLLQYYHMRSAAIVTIDISQKLFNKLSSVSCLWYDLEIALVLLNLFILPMDEFKNE